jgi:hypothetical protein
MGWHLTWRGRFLAIGLILAGMFSAKLWLFSFLTPSEFVSSKLLIFEGWSPTFTAGQVVEIFRSHNFEKVLVVRSITDATNAYESGRFNGEYMRNLLVQDGIPADRVTIIFPLVAKKDRTYHSALAAKEWMEKHNIPTDAIDVTTIGPHSRRSRLLYEKAFGSGTKVGILPLTDTQYDPDHWWRTSEGVRDIISESIAYVYARTLFRASSS